MDERARLISAIETDPDAVENWIVYADWLLDRGDPRGELIALELAIDARVANEEAKDRHEALMEDLRRWVSPRLEAELHRHVKIVMQRGFIRVAYVSGTLVDPPTTETLTALYSDPHGCLLRRLNIGDHGKLLETTVCTTARELSIAPTSSELSFASSLPNLRTMSIDYRGFDPDLHVRVERIAHPRLEILDVHTRSVPALFNGAFDLPNLQGLSFLCDPNDPLALFRAHAIFTNPPPRLTTVDVENQTAEFIRALRESPICPQLRVLSLNLDAEIIEELAREPAPFQHITLRGWGYAHSDGEREEWVERMAALFPNVQLHFGGNYVPQEPVPPIDPSVLQNVGDAVTRLAERVRKRLT